MNINISNEMAQAVVAALRMHVERHGNQSFGPKEDYQVTNQEALEFFEDLLTFDKNRKAFLSVHMQDNKAKLS